MLGAVGAVTTRLLLACTEGALQAVLDFELVCSSQVDLAVDDLTALEWAKRSGSTSPTLFLNYINSH